MVSADDILARANPDAVLDSVETGAKLVSGTTINSNTAWHVGNDGNNFHSDSLDGKHATDLHPRTLPETLGLQAWYKFDMGSGTTAYDYNTVGDAKSGSITGATWVSGQSGNALDFDGTDDYCATRQYYGSGTGGRRHGLTVTFWLKKQSGGDSSQRYVSCDLSDWWGFYEDASGNVTWFVNDGGGTDYTVTGTYTQGSWEHWAGVVDIGVPEIRLYKNGSLTASIGISRADWGSGSVSRYVNVGCGSESGTFDTPQSSTYSSCVVDSLRIYHRTLPQATIQDIYNGNS